MAVNKLLAWVLSEGEDYLAAMAGAGTCPPGGGQIVPAMSAKGGKMAAGRLMKEIPAQRNHDAPWPHGGGKGAQPPAP